MACCSRPPPSSTTRTPTRPRTGARAAFRPGARCARACCWPGPGRQDLTGEFGLDVTVPGYHSARYAGHARACARGRAASSTRSACPGSWRRRGWRSRTGPAPRTRRRPGWSGWSRSPGARSRTRSRRSACPTAIAAPPGARCCSTCATSARWACSTIRFRACSWSDAIYGRRPRCRAAATRGDPVDVRRRVGARASWRTNRRAGTRGDATKAATADAVARGRAIFAERIVGTIANRQIFKRAPRAYAAAKLDGPVLAPIDPTKPLDAKLPVRCADCHAARAAGDRAAARREPAAARALHALPRRARRRGRVGPRDPTLSPPSGERATLVRDRRPLRREFGPGRRRRSRSARGATRSTATSGRWSTRRAGCSRSMPTATATRRATRPPIGARAASAPSRCWRSTCPDHAAAVLARRRRHRRPGARRPRRPRPHRRRLGARRAPRRRCARARPTCTTARCRRCARCSSPPRAARSRFPLGAAGFVLDTRVPGNGNQGHEFGTALSARREAGPGRFLETL